MHYDESKFVFHAFAYGMLPYRTIDAIYKRKFNITTKIDMGLNELGQHHGTDKHYYHNYYTRVYENLLRPYKSHCDILEIGVLGGASLKIWDDFFESGVVHGADIQPKSLDYGRTECFIVDQSNEDSLKSFAENGQKYDIIVDDGSHRMRDQQSTVQILFKSLKSGGYFVIEDVQTSTECRMPSKAIFGWGDPEKTTCLDMLYSIINGDPKCDYKTSEWDSFISEIEEIKITQDREDSILATIKKK
jgi:SAM-dependent methyltransferase